MSATHTTLSNINNVLLIVNTSIEKSVEIFSVSQTH